jgi:hypothetical protein
MSLPEQFQNPNIRLLKVRARGKEAVEKNWQTVANYGASSPVIQEWVLNGGNYGVTSPFGFYCSIDADTDEIQAALERSLPTTFRWSTGKTGHFQYGYYLADTPIVCIPLSGGAYVKGKGGYALGPGSVHPNGATYGAKEIREVPIATVNRDDLLAAIQPFLIAKPGELYGNKTMESGTGNIDTATLIEILKPYWAKADGMRNEFTLDLAGFIARSGGTEAQAVYVISELAQIIGKGADHVAGANYAFNRTGKLRGFSSLDELLRRLEDGEE